LGSNSRQSYSSDTFCLGLSFFHLLTGEEPYEELLKDIKCPNYLYKKLFKIWENCDIDSNFYVIKKVIDSLDDSEDNDCKLVLYNTFYRYLVLFGLPNDNIDEFNDDDSLNFIKDNDVLSLVIDCLGNDNQNGKQKIKCKNQYNEDCRLCKKQYNEDCRLWSFKYGSHKIIERLKYQ
jgi:hypothetical protein